MQKELSEMTLEELWQLFPIILTEPNKRWKKYYDEEKNCLLLFLKDINVTRISHIGSTAINSIWAKPIIDILIEVDERQTMNMVHDKLVEQGYICMNKAESRIDFNKGYTKHGFAEKVFHIHLRLTGDNDELYFRDYLIDNPVIAKDYERLKLLLWKQYEHDRDGYTSAKSEFIKKYTDIAKEIYKNRY